MAKLPRIPFRRKKTPAEHAFDAVRSALKFWAGTKAAKAVKHAAERKRRPVLGLGLLAGGAVAAKKLRGRGGSTPEPYTPPPPPAATSPREDPGTRESPHGDVAADLLPGDDRQAAPGGRNVGAARDETSTSGGGDEPAGTTGTGGEGRSAAAPPLGTGGTSTGSASDMPGGDPAGEQGEDAPSTIAPGTPAGESPGGEVPPLPAADDEQRAGESTAPPPSIPPTAS